MMDVMNRCVAESLNSLTSCAKIMAKLVNKMHLMKQGWSFCSSEVGSTKWESH